MSENGIILCAAAEVEALLRRGEDVLMEREALKHYIISAWLDRDRTGLTASRALDWLHGQDLLDDETLMLGFSAACTAAVSQLPPSPPPATPLAAPSLSLELPEAWEFDNLELLSTLSKVRIA